jgi:hypothetical protein
MRRVRWSARRELLAGYLLPASLIATSAAALTFKEDFAAGQLDATRWQRTVDGDLRAYSTDVVPRDAGAGYRLRISADTMGTRDEWVKHVGLRSACALSSGPNTRLRISLDWGPPQNGSYLAAAVVLSPHKTDANPEATADWLSIGYVGVPPGRNARLLVTSRANGVVRTLYTEGWPDRNREGRMIARAELELVWQEASLDIREDGRLLHTVGLKQAPFASTYVYLQLSSHSNYRARAVHFADLRLTQGDNDVAVSTFPAAPDCNLSR